MPESPDQRQARERRRRLFDGIAARYEQARRGYSREMLAWVLKTAGAVPGSRVLEIGCGTGQLTRQLADFDLAITAIDIGESMVALARRAVPSGRVRFMVSAFEDARLDPGFDLIVSGSAFHWIDPAIGWQKSAALLQPSGWVALLGVMEEYDEPLPRALRELWIRHGAAWESTGAQTSAEPMIESGLFAAPLIRTHREPVLLRPDEVLSVERTRATYLDFDEAGQHSFTSGLEQALAGMEVVPAAMETTVTMAQVRRGEGRD